jgi:hypothetical protein
MASNDSKDDELKNKPENSEENFGLPDIEYKPLDQPGQPVQQREEPPTERSTYTYEPAPDEPKSKAPIILGIVIVLVIAAAGYLIYNFVYKPRQEADRIRQEQKDRDAAELRKQQAAEKLRQQQEARERARMDSIANAKPKIGTIETLSARTRRYYVVVTSDVDDDLLMDFARKLSLKGISSKVIPPYGDLKFYRLAIADHDTWQSAQTAADAVKPQYGAGVWVIKY